MFCLDDYPASALFCAVLYCDMIAQFARPEQIGRAACVVKGNWSSCCARGREPLPPCTLGPRDSARGNPIENTHNMKYTEHFFCKIFFLDTTTFCFFVLRFVVLLRATFCFLLFCFFFVCFFLVKKRYFSLSNCCVPSL